MSVGTGRLKYQFHCWEYINGNQTFILDSHRPPSFAVQGRGDCQSFSHVGLKLTEGAPSKVKVIVRGFPMQD